MGRLLRGCMLGVVATAMIHGAANAGERELMLSAGRNDFSRPQGSDSTELGAELRLGNRELAHWSWGSVIPAFGVSGTQDGTLYGYGGFRLHVPLGRLRIGLHTAIGHYDRGDGRDLGGSVEFRSGLEIAYRLRHRLYLGLEFHHLSNAGIYDRNPGVNSLVASVSVRPWQDP